MDPRSLDAVGLLARCDLFRGLAPAHLRMVADSAAVVSLPKRECLFHEGGAGAAMYVLVAGSVQLSKASEDGREVVIRTVEPGETFAEVMLFESDRFPVTAVALKKSEVLRLDRRAFVRLLEDGRFRADFIALLMRRMRYLTDRILELTLYDAEERLVRFLSRQYGERREYAIPLSKRDLAAAIGATPETLSRLIKRLTAEGRISWSGRTLRLMKREP